MALGMYFTPTSFTPARYDAAGRLYHVALETGSQIQVFDVWDSQESFQAFGATLVPILAELGVDPGEPQVSSVHNIIEG
ncbi:MAG: hypothetical protein ABSH04_06750 [Acidimicrobiales bacterium]